MVEFKTRDLRTAEPPVLVHLPKAPRIPHDAALIDADAFKLAASRGKKRRSKHSLGRHDVDVNRPLLATELGPLCGKQAQVRFRQCPDDEELFPVRAHVASLWCGTPGQRRP